MGRHKYGIRPATEEDAEILSRKLRRADIDEMEALGEDSPLKVLLASMRSSDDARAGLIDGEVVCLFGVAKSSLMSIRGAPWLLASDALEGHAKPFLRISREFVRQMGKDYQYLCNFVDARNKHAIKWLKWLGFDILPTQEYGPYGAMFHPFEMKG